MLKHSQIKAIKSQKHIRKCGFCQTTSISSDENYVNRSMKHHLQNAHSLTNVKKYSDKVNI